MRKTIIATMALAFLLTAGFAAARAQNAEEKDSRRAEKTETLAAWKEELAARKAEIRANAENQKQQYRELRQKFTEEKCERITARIQAKTTNFGTSKEKHTQVYTNLVNRIQKFADRFKTAGLNTAQLETDLATLNGMIADFKTAYANYIAKLNATKTYACGQSEGAFRTQLVDARAELKIVHDTAADIRTFVRTTIFADLKALKAQMPKDENEESNETENEDAQDNDDSATDTTDTTEDAATGDTTTETTTNTGTVDNTPTTTVTNTAQ